jgi:macrolide transport system ATP-binding/permease protein
MPLLPRLSSLWRNLFRKSRQDRDLTEEIDAYLEMLIEQKINAGLDPAEARRAAMIELGDREQVKEKVREPRVGHHLETLWRDLCYALRMLRRSPSFSTVAALLLALGIGANTAIFSVVDAVLLKSLPVKDPERLVLLSHTNSGKYSDRFSYSNYEQIRDHDRTLSGVLAYYPLRLTVSVDGQPEPAINGQLVTGSYYQVLGVNAMLGRTLAPEDDRAPGEHPVCVISHGYWRRRFGGDPGVVGKTIHLGGYPFTIIGVTPPEFFGAEVGSSMDISAPLVMQQQVMPGVRSFVNEDWERFRLMGRLRPGVTLEQAQGSLGLLYQQYVADLVVRWTGEKGRNEANRYKADARLMVASGNQGPSDLRQQFSQPMFVLMLIVALALLIACANVAGLLLARGVTRRKELAVRLALGAGRLRLARQLFTESLLLACLGSLLGLLLAWWGTRLLLPLLSQGEIPIHLSVNPDLRMLSFTAGVIVLTSMLFGLAPAFLATRIELQSTLKQDSPGMSDRRALSFGRVFVIAQVALSLLLLVGAGLFVRSLQNLLQTPTGYAREKVLVLKLEPVRSDDKGPQHTAFYDELLRRVKGLPGVQQTSLVGYSPISRREWLVMGENPEQRARTVRQLYVEGHPLQSEAEITINFMQVYPNSFATLGIPLVAGRDIGPQDTRGSQEVAVINESMARLLFGRENPIGRRFGQIYPVRCCPREIIGVVKDAKYISLRQEGRPMFYAPFAQLDTSMGQMTLVVRTAGDIAPIAAAIQREARALDPGMPRFEVETLAAQLDASLTQERLVATLSSVFGLLALVLACIGLYGVMAYDVARRTHEIGIRMALGASAPRIVQLVVGDTLRLVGIGVVIGLGAALVATRWVKSLLFGLQPHDPLTIGLAVLLLLAVAAVAGYLPARRASRVDPMVALRHD